MMITRIMLLQLLFSFAKSASSGSIPPALAEEPTIRFSSFLNPQKQGFPEFFFLPPFNVQNKGLQNFHYLLRPGMSAVPEWLKSLRLHKYTGLVGCHAVFDHVYNILFLNVRKKENVVFLR